MKKSTFFNITQGAMWGLICSQLGYNFPNWQFFVITLLGIFIWLKIYNNCEND